MADYPQSPTMAVDPMRGQVTLTKKGLEAPDNIIKSPQSARAIYSRLREDHVKRISLYAAIEGLIAGNPPYDPQVLAQNGLSHISNFNTMEARSFFERAAQAYWNLLNQAETLIKFTLTGSDYDNPQAREWEQIMSEEWDHVVRKWPQFYTRMNILSGQLVKLGISPAFFPDEKDWQWETIELSKFYLPDQSQSDLQNLTCLAVESYLTVQYLFDVYEEAKDSEASNKEYPWSSEELERLLLWLGNTFNKAGSTSFSNVMELQQKVQSGDLSSYLSISDSVRIISLFQKEYDGSISHYKFHRDLATSEDFLFFADRQYESFAEALAIFTASPGEHTVHSNRGFGHKMFSVAQGKLQLDCSIMDAAKWASTPMIKGLAGTKDFQQIRFYPGVPTNIGQSEFVANNMGSNINQLVGASQYFSQQMQFNIANSGDDPGLPDRDQGSKSPTEFKARAFKEFGVLKNNIAHYYDQADRLFQEMVRKQLRAKEGYPNYDYVAEWKNRCIDRGVDKRVFDYNPDKLSPWGLPRHLECKATRVAGDGSTVALLMGLQEIMPMASMFGPREAKALKRLWIIATFGPEYVSTFQQDSDRADEEAGGASLAAVENGIMKLSQSPVFSKDNEQRSHYGTHMALAEYLIQAIQQQQMSPIDADKVFSVLMPHLSEHFNALMQSIFDRAFAEQQKDTFIKVEKYAQYNRQNAARMYQAEIRKRQEDEQATQEVMSDAQRKDFVVQKDAQRADFKVQAQVERAKEANTTRAEVMREKVSLDADNTRRKVELEAQAKSSASRPLAEESTNELRQGLADINGMTPAPTDIEGL